ncbi:MAG TPA: tetratricopeptide repeat protein [Methanotrichaceae archaeon]|nr:tetratricopeptide repeat protein [Methanotrichaceae archaeon]HQF17430.1 tetratricopeptide repeat protein [Methanotrichaceae archaeon]HQI92294.1 tetratricopeptide repeat protein [Methanotrichaceae archaeon]
MIGDKPAMAFGHWPKAAGGFLWGSSLISSEALLLWKRRSVDRLRKMFWRVGNTAPGRLMTRLLTIGNLTFCIVALSSLCGSAIAQENASGTWSHQEKTESVASNLNEYEKAILRYDEVLRQNPDDANAWKGKGDAFKSLALSRDDPDIYNESIKAYNRALDLDPDLADAWFGKGSVYFNQGSSKEALEAIDMAIKIDHRNPKYWEGKAIALFPSSESLIALDKAIGLWPVNQTDGLSGSWLIKGQYLLQMNRLDEAVEAFDEALRINPAEHDIWRSRGDALSSMGKYNESIDAYERAIELEPGDYGVWECLGDVLEIQGKREAAINAYRKSIELIDNSTRTRSNSSDYDYWTHRGGLLIRLGRYNESLVAYDNAIRAWPSGNSVMAWKGKGDLLGVMGRYDEALEAYDQAIHLVPIYAEAWQKKGGILIALGRNYEAEMAFSRARDIYVRGQGTDG